MIKKIIASLVKKTGYRLVKIEKRPVSSKSKGFLELAEDYRSKTVLKLHFGCGPRILKDWVNIDILYAHYSQYMKYYTEKYYPENLRGNLEDYYEIDVTKTGLPLPDNSVDVIFHEDFIEHLSQKEQFLFLAETYRVLKPNGVHRINTPDLISSMKKSKFTNGFNGVYKEEWEKNTHINILSKTTLKEAAELIGYKKVMFNSRDKSVSNLIPAEYRPDPNDREEDGNIFADLVK